MNSPIEVLIYGFHDEARGTLTVVEGGQSEILVVLYVKGKRLNFSLNESQGLNLYNQLGHLLQGLREEGTVDP